MSVTIRGTDTSAATPSFTGSDGDSGLFFPAANQVALSTNGTQAVLVNSSQNVGIKTSTPGTDLQVNDTTSMGTGSAVADILSVTNNNGVLSGVAGDRLGIVMSAMSDLSDRRVGLYCRAQNANFNNPDFSIWQTGQGIAYRETLRVTADSSATLQFNSGYGSAAAAYGCRAWVNFNGQTNGIRASGNVSSITDQGVGVYQINFSSSLVDANYSVQCLTSGQYNSAHTVAYIGAGNQDFAGYVPPAPATGSFYIVTCNPLNGGQRAEGTQMMVSVFR